MKTTNLNPLFIDMIKNFAHLVTKEPQSKDEFLNNIKKTYSLASPKTEIFYHSVKLSTFETIRLNNTKDSILFNQ